MAWGWPWQQTFHRVFRSLNGCSLMLTGGLVELAKRGVKVFVALPGFTSDCLETLDEIAMKAGKPSCTPAGQTACLPV